MAVSPQKKPASRPSTPKRKTKTPAAKAPPQKKAPPKERRPRGPRPPTPPFKPLEIKAEDLTSDTLSPRQRRFVEEYLIDHNAARAYMASGFQVSTTTGAAVRGCILLSHPAVRLAIQEGFNRLQNHCRLSQEWVICRLMENAERAMQLRQVLDEKGRPTGEYAYDGAVANRALELLGRHVGMWNTRKLEVSGNLTHDHDHRHDHSHIQIDLSQLQLPPETLREISKAMIERDEMQKKLLSALPPPAAEPPQEIIDGTAILKDEQP